MLIDIILERNVKEYLKSVNGKYTTYLMQQIVIGAVIGLIVAVAFTFTKGQLGLLGIVLSILGVVVGFKIVYIQLIQEINKRKRIRVEQFPDFLKYFSALIVVNNLNVVNTLESTVSYLQEPLKTEVENLHKRLARGEGREAFLDFANYIGTSDAIMVLGVLSDFNDYGVDTQKLRDLEETVNNLNDAIVEEKIIRDAGKIERMANYSLLGAMAFVLIFVGVMFIQIFSEINI